MWSRTALVPLPPATHQGHAQDLGEGVGGASWRGDVQGGTWSLEPGPLAGPHHVTQGQDGGAQAQRRPVYRHHDGLLEVDERRDKLSRVAQWSNGQQLSQDWLRNQEPAVTRCRHGAQTDSLPYGVGDAAALFPAVGGQAADQVGRLQAVAENCPHRAEQQQLAVVGGCIGQRSAQFLHDLWRKVQEVDQFICYSWLKNYSIEQDKIPLWSSKLK